MWREMIIFADTQTINQASKQILNLITEAHSYPLWIVGERANKEHLTYYGGPHKVVRATCSEYYQTDNLTQSSNSLSPRYVSLGK